MGPVREQQQEGRTPPLAPQLPSGLGRIGLGPQGLWAPARKAPLHLSACGSALGLEPAEDARKLPEAQCKQAIHSGHPGGGAVPMSIWSLGPCSSDPRFCSFVAMQSSQKWKAGTPQRS